MIQVHDGGSDGFDILLKGERGRRRSRYLLWKADTSGQVVDRSRWMTGNDLVADGYEPVFGVDLNGNGSIGV